ncbi:YqhR family membrane protein [Cohnella faecalis]|uniref:YqhR family membrane protein n=1 Tax=Cohnella faecalis TaxID=2315694 RepID=UPI0013149A86|nr:YqhR family membrane protein [Cohnella faecalis]
MSKNTASEGEKAIEHFTNPILFSLKVGLFAGIVWGVVRWLETGMNFTQVHQAFLVDPFVKRSMLGSFGWQAIGFAAFIVMSMIAAMFYLIVLGKLRGPWPGIAFGVVWWALLFLGAGPLVGAVPPLKTISWTSYITDFCLFLLWGLFIGYSIAFEFHDEMHRERGGGGSSGSRKPAHG